MEGQKEIFKFMGVEEKSMGAKTNPKEFIKFPKKTSFKVYGVWNKQTPDKVDKVSFDSSRI